MANATSFTFGTRMKGDLPSARPAVEAALRAEGFGVVTGIDVKAIRLVAEEARARLQRVIATLDRP